MAPFLELESNRSFSTIQSFILLLLLYFAIISDHLHRQIANGSTFTDGRHLPPPPPATLHSYIGHKPKNRFYRRLPCFFLPGLYLLEICTCQKLNRDKHFQDRYITKENLSLLLRKLSHVIWKHRKKLFMRCYQNSTVILFNISGNYLN